MIKSASISYLERDPNILSQFILLFFSLYNPVGHMEGLITKIHKGWCNMLWEVRSKVWVWKYFFEGNSADEEERKVYENYGLKAIKVYPVKLD